MLSLNSRRHALSGAHSSWRGLEIHVADKIIPMLGTMPSCIVDIGVYYGYSLFSFATLFPYTRVFGIDNWSYENDESMKYAFDNLVHFDNAEIWSMDSDVAARQFGKLEYPIDVLHIDGDHSYEGVKQDFELWAQMVRNGGIVLFHDTASDDPKCGAGRFFSQLPGDKIEIEEHNGLGIWKKP